MHKQIALIGVLAGLLMAPVAWGQSDQELLDRSRWEHAKEDSQKEASQLPEDTAEEMGEGEDPLWPAEAEEASDPADDEAASADEESVAEETADAEPTDDEDEGTPED